MRKIACTAPIRPLEKVIKSLTFTVDGTGILMGNGQWQGIPDWALAVLGPFLGPLLDDNDGKLKHVMVNVILPKGGSPVHVDPSPDGVLHSRWHLPLKTNPDAYFCYFGEDPVHMEAGYWHGPVEYWRSHFVQNDGDEPRTHLIVDLA